MTEPALSHRAFVNLLSGDLAAMREAISKHSWSELTIFANRFASDAALFSDSDPEYTARFLSLALRVVSEDTVQAFARISAQKESVDPLVDVVSTFVGNTAELLPEMDSKFVQLCSAYFHFEGQVGIFQQSPAEQAAYAGAESLGSKLRQRLGQLILDNATALKKRDTILAEGVLNEFSRVCRVTPFEEKDLCFFSVVKSYALLSGYWRFLATLSDDSRPIPLEKLDEERTANVSHLLDFIGSLDKTDTPGAWEMTRAYVGPTMQRWRELYVLNMEPPQPILARPAGTKMTPPNEKKTKTSKKA
jgi:hypothetical protein